MAKRHIKKICFVVSTEMSAFSFLLPHIKEMSIDHDVSVVVNTKNVDLFKDKGVKVTVIPVTINREIRLLSDAKNLITLYYLFKKTL